MSGKKAPSNQGHKHARDTRVWRVFFRTSPHDRQSHDMRPAVQGHTEGIPISCACFLTLWERIIIIIINYNNKILFEDDLAISSAHPVLKGHYWWLAANSKLPKPKSRNAQSTRKKWGKQESRSLWHKMSSSWIWAGKRRPAIKGTCMHMAPVCGG